MFGVPHSDFGEAVVVAVVQSPATVSASASADLTSDEQSLQIGLADVEAALAGKLARFKQPKHLISLPELPRNTMGKVQKNLLREAHATLFTTN